MRKFLTRKIVTACLAAALLLTLHLLAPILTAAPKEKHSSSPARAGKANRTATPAPSRQEDAAGRVYYRGKVVVLMYHNISPTYHGRGAITPETFAAEIAALVRSGHPIIPVQELVAFLHKKDEVPPNAVVITFDDGYEGVYRYAFPALKEFRVPATVFLIGSYIGKKEGFLTWPQVREMAASGLFTFGGHTFNAHYGAPRDQIQPHRLP